MAAKGNYVCLCFGSSGSRTRRANRAVIEGPQGAYHRKYQNIFYLRTVRSKVQSASCKIKKLNNCSNSFFRENKSLTFFSLFFYRAMLCIRGTSHGPVSVRLSVCPSQVGVLLKRLNVGAHKQHHTIAEGL